MNINEVKFRGKHVITGQWFYGLLIGRDIIGKVEYIGKKPDIIEYCKIIPETLGQYVGKKDDDGIEIYTGDLVDCKSKGYGRGEAEVMFFPEYGCFGLYQEGSNKLRPMGSSGSSTPYRPYSWKSFKSIKIIGNKHKNVI